METKLWNDKLFSKSNHVVFQFFNSKSKQTQHAYHRATVEMCIAITVWTTK